MCQLLKALLAEIRSAQHQQRRDRPGNEGADGQRRRHEDGLVYHRALAHRPHHRQFAIGLHAGNLLRVECQVVAQYAGRFLGRHLAQYGNVIQDAGNVVDQRQQAGCGHRRTTRFCSKRAAVVVHDRYAGEIDVFETADIDGRHVVALRIGAFAIRVHAAHRAEAVLDDVLVEGEGVHAE